MAGRALIHDLDGTLHLLDASDPRNPVLRTPAGGAHLLDRRGTALLVERNGALRTIQL